MAITVDGEAIAARIQEELRQVVEKSLQKPRLDIFVVGDDPVTASFVSTKRRYAKDLGIEFVEHTLDESATTEDVISAIVAAQKNAGGIVVQLPLPGHIDSEKVLSTIDTDKDVDVLNEQTYKRFLEESTNVVPPVAGAVLEILKAHSVNLEGTNVAIVGRGKLVGAPTKDLLTKEGANVNVLDSKTPDSVFRTTLKEADIVVSGAGVPDLITPELLKEGSVVIDAGTSSTEGAVRGDVATGCAEVARIISKTPGGVGPVTVAVLFRNLMSLS